MSKSGQSHKPQIDPGVAGCGKALPYLMAHAVGRDDEDLFFECVLSAEIGEESTCSVHFNYLARYWE